MSHGNVTSIELLVVAASCAVAACYIPAGSEVRIALVVAVIVGTPAAVSGSGARKDRRTGTFLRTPAEPARHFSRRYIDINVYNGDSYHLGAP
jgi:hypothetical protein